jgi:hypothetical protein
MTNDKLFTGAYWLMHLAPLYAIVGVVLGMMGVSGLVVLAPLLLFAAAAAYIASRKCPNCRQTIYTVENLGKVEGGLSRLPVHRFRHCPACGGNL